MIGVMVAVLDQSWLSLIETHFATWTFLLMSLIKFWSWVDLYWNFGWISEKYKHKLLILQYYSCYEQNFLYFCLELRISIFSKKKQQKSKIVDLDYRRLKIIFIIYSALKNLFKN